jgi:L,D-peptidoglycan transpeptidase YkuD (ErfK/YbiS/YcfS/YnhG family)
VRCLQSRLTALGYPVGPLDGAFGNMTHNGVVRYQRAKGLLADGVVGRQTGTSLGIWGTAASGGGTAGATNCTPPASVPASARQVVVVNSSGSRADVDLLMFGGGRWTCARMDMPARVGRNGVRALANRRSGDGTTPGGVFPLGSMTAPNGQTFQFFGNGVNPGVRGTWHQVRAGDCWAAIPNRPSYNLMLTRPASQCVSPDEYLVNFQQSYSRAAIIGANMGPNRSGDAPGEPPLAAAIFLHRHSYDTAGNSRPTSGCVSLNNTNLIYVLQRLVPGQAYFVIR